MIEYNEFETRVYYCLEGLDRAINITEIRDTLYYAYDDIEEKPSQTRIRNILRSWCIRGYCHEITISGRSGYYYILSGKGKEYIIGLARK